MALGSANGTSLDSTSILLNVLGWIVAGFVTLLGVLLAHRIQQRGEKLHEAEVTIYAPLRMEMLFLVGQKDRPQTGVRLWNEWGTEFQGIYYRGLLVPKRNEALRRGADRLIELRNSHNTAQQELQRSVGEGMAGVWRLVSHELGSRPWDGTLTSFMQSPDAGMSTGLVWTLVRGQKQDFVWQFNATVTDLRKGADRPALRTHPEDYYTLADGFVRAKREPYQKSCDALLEQAQRIKDGLERALQDGTFYH